MLEKIKNFIEKNHLLESNKTIICATSGGVDSVCLIHLLVDLGYSCVLAHVNHHKRKQSEQEQISMEKLANELNCPFELLSYHDSHQENFQATAHHARYDFFKKLADQYHTDIIATAHHLDDQAETILMRLLSGSNLYGYGGISCIANLGDYKLVRPLLCVSKDELYKYAKSKNYIYFEDESNESDAYLRNRIRHHIIPLLKQESEHALEKIQEFSSQAKEAFEFIRNQSIKYLEELNNNIKVEQYKLLPIALQKDIICLLLEKYNIIKNQEMILNCLNLIMKNENKKIQLNSTYFFQVEYGMACIVEQNDSVSFRKTITLNEECILLNHYHFYFSKNLPQNNAKYIKLCYNSLKFPFIIRNFQKGDFMNMKYGSKKVSRIFIDEKIPKEKRTTIPLVFDSDGLLLWIYPNIRSKEVFSQKENGDIYFVCEEIGNV